MSRRRNPRQRQTVIPAVQRLDLRCPVTSSHSLGTVVRDVAGVRLRPAVDNLAETAVDAAKVPLRRDGTRLRWTCPACRRAGLYEDRQLRWDRVVDVLDAMAAALVAERLRVRLDVGELTRQTEHLRHKGHRR